MKKRFSVVKLKINFYFYFKHATQLNKIKNKNEI